MRIAVVSYKCLIGRGVTSPPVTYGRCFETNGPRTKFPTVKINNPRQRTELNVSCMGALHDDLESDRAFVDGRAGFILIFAIIS